MRSGPWGHDREWERSVIERIRAGGAAPCTVSLYDAVPQAYWEPSGGLNIAGWEYAEEHSKDAIRSGAVYLNDEAIAKREAKRKLFREGVREALAEAKVRADKEAADRLEKQRAKDEARRQWEADQAAREARVREEREAWNAEAERRRKEIAERIRLTAGMNILETQKYINEEKRILASKWICTKCNDKSTIERRNDGYQLTCLSCGKTAFGSHKSLWEVVNR